MIRNALLIAIAGTVSLCAQVPAGLPPANGVYVQLGTTFVSLEPNLITPGASHRVGNYFGVQAHEADAKLLGSRSIMQSTDARPTFYLRGISPANGIYLVKQQQHKGHREAMMRVSSHFADGPAFKQADLRDFDIQSLGPDLISLRPRMDLAAGEYAIISPAGRGYRWIQMGFEFGIVRR
jgi:hypothetical protein